MKKDQITTSNPITAKLHFSVISSISKGAREYQEDACGHWSDATSQRLFAVVADGAGGHGGGAEAAQAAIESSAKSWKQSSDEVFVDSEAFLTEWIKNAHLAVNEASAKIHHSARAVVVACLTDGSTAHWAHAGDSRLLRFHQGKLAERTRDDSVVQVLFERGEITEQEMGTHPDQSRLLQSLGGEDLPRPRIGSARVSSGDVLILCSDGFWEHLKQEELEKLAATDSESRQKALDEAVAEAVLRAGEKADNTTALMICVDEKEDRPNLTKLYWSLLALVVAILIFLLTFFWANKGYNLRGLWNEWMQGDKEPSEQLFFSTLSADHFSDTTPNPEMPSSDNALSPEITH